MIKCPGCSLPSAHPRTSSPNAAISFEPARSARLSCPGRGGPAARHRPAAAAPRLPHGRRRGSPAPKIVLNKSLRQQIFSSLSPSDSYNALPRKKRESASKDICALKRENTFEVEMEFPQRPNTRYDRDKYSISLWPRRFLRGLPPALRLYGLETIVHINLLHNMII